MAVTLTSAAGAVLAYQELLGVLTPLRYDTIRIGVGAFPLPIYNEPTMIAQRSCAAFEASAPALRAAVARACGFEAHRRHITVAAKKTLKKRFF